MDRILVVDDEPYVLDVLTEVLQAEGFQVAQAASGPTALASLDREPFALVLSDIRVPDMGDFELVRGIRRSHPGTDILMMSDYATIDGALEAMTLGAADYLTKPLKAREVVARIRAILERRKLEAQVHQLQSELSARFDLHNIVAVSPRMATVVSALRRVAPTDDPVLISGEKGTGRKFIARAIHYASHRRSRDFFHCVRCDLIPQDRAAAEIFGHVDENGRHRRGALERFAGGTLHFFMAEALPPATQRKLAACLATRQFAREGEGELRPLEARLLFSTGRPPADLLQQGLLHADLQLLRELVTINVPPLRHRHEDVPGLVDLFLKSYAAEQGRSLVCSSQTVITKLTEQEFASNVEQLFSVLRHCASMSLDGELTPELVERALRQAPLTTEDQGAMAMHLDDREYQLVLHAVQRNPGRLDQAARELGVSRTTLWRRMRKYGIKVGRQGGGRPARR